MPALRELQHDMSAAIRAAAATERLETPKLASLAHPDRLFVHARNFRTGLTAVLASIFPATQRLAGEGFFAFAAAQFIAAHPPTDPILVHYGAHFPAFLCALPVLAKSPWLADAARLEWTIHALSDVPPPPPLDLSKRAGLADAYLIPHEGAALIHTSSPASDLIDPEADTATLDVTQPCHLLLTAAPQGVVQNHLAPGAFAFLAALFAGQPLSAALAAHAHHDPVATLRLAARLGAFSAIHPIEDHT